MSNKHMKRCSVTLIIRVIQTKPKMKHHLTASRMVIIFKKIENDKCWWEHGKIGTLLYFCWEFKMVQLLWKTVQQFLKKLKIELPYGPAIPLLGMYPKELKAGSREHLSIHVHSNITHNSSKVKATQGPFSQRYGFSSSHVWM